MNTTQLTENDISYLTTLGQLAFPGAAITVEQSDQIELHIDWPGTERFGYTMEDDTIDLLAERLNFQIEQINTPRHEDGWDW